MNFNVKCKSLKKNKTENAHPYLFQDNQGSQAWARLHGMFIHTRTDTQD